MHIGKVDTKVMPGEWPLVRRRQALLIQLHTVGPTHQRHQQVFAVVAQARFKVALQTCLEQPQAGLRQHHADNHHHADQPQAQAPLD